MENFQAYVRIVLIVSTVSDSDGRVKVEASVRRHMVARVDGKHIDANASICASCGGVSLII